MRLPIGCRWRQQHDQHTLKLMYYESIEHTYWIVWRPLDSEMNLFIIGIDFIIYRKIMQIIHLIRWEWKSLQRNRIRRTKPKFLKKRLWFGLNSVLNWWNRTDALCKTQPNYLFISIFNSQLGTFDELNVGWAKTIDLIDPRKWIEWQMTMFDARRSTLQCIACFWEM